MILQKSIQEVLETARIEDVVGDFVNLKRRGVNLIGLCPFHTEKTPSFTVSPSKNICKCFGCGEGGNPVQFIMSHENMTFPEAIRYLAKKYGIQLEETVASPEVIQAQQRQDSLYIINQFAAEYYQDHLLNTDRGKNIALTYFKERGFREEVIKAFGLGYAPNGGKEFTIEADKKGYNTDLLKELGLTARSGYDFFRDRVMFPIYNLSGKVIGFGGRILKKKAKAPKYINSPETEIYNKSKVLYGAYQAKKAIRKEDECILVEGYTDVISLHQAGVQNVVASSGTSLTPGQVQLIKRYTPNIKILYDGDSAGIKAALRGLDIVLEQDMNVKVVILPEGEDPDSYVQKVGAGDLKLYLKEKEQDFILFKSSLLNEDAGNDPVKRTQMIRDVVGSIAKVPDPIKRSLYVRECARVLDVEEQLLINETNKLIGQNYRKKQQQKEVDQLPNPTAVKESGDLVSHQAKAEPKSSGDEFQEKDIVRIIIQFADKIFDQEEKITVAEFLLHNIEDVIDDFDHKLYQSIIQEAFEKIKRGKKLTSDYFISHKEANIRKLALDLISDEYEYSENWEKRWEIYLNTQKMPDENFQKDSQNALKRFRLKKIIRKCQQNQEKIKELGKQGKMDELMLHMRLQQKLLDMRNELANELGTVVL
ncbi:MAG: DNA primase [Bacteroidota bacterium]